jgi:hypothetical protein
MSNVGALKPIFVGSERGEELRIGQMKHRSVKNDVTFTSNTAVPHTVLG